MIRKIKKGEYSLDSKKTGKSLGKHPSKAAAARQEAAINISKKRGKKYGKS